MDAEPGFELFGKLKLMSTSEFDEADVVERCPKNRYIRYNEMLGRGAFKTVYKAFDEVEGIEVAWNQVSVDNALQSSEHLERLYSEVRLLKTLKHENVIKSFVSWVDDEKKTINMITELFTSGNLRQYCKKHKSVDIKAIKNWARQILRGLAYLHSHEPPIIHRDLKCDNIFVNGNHGEVKIGDLGLATLMQCPPVKSVIGTPEFMAPELYEEEYNELVDIYSFGMCILELITCEYPYSECKNQAQIYKKVTSGIKPAALAKVKDPQVKQFIEKCLVPVSQRLPAVELLKDPFLSPECPKMQTCDSIRHKSINLPEVASTPMDVDLNDNKLSGSSACMKGVSDTTHVSSIEFQSFNERTDIRLRGEKIDGNSILLTLRIVETGGHLSNIDFTFYLDSDTTLSIAGEMVEQLDLLPEDVAIIAEMIDNLILKFVPTWKPSVGVSSGGTSSSKNSDILQNGRVPVISASGEAPTKDMFDQHVQLAKAQNQDLKDLRHSSATNCSMSEFTRSWGASPVYSCKNTSNDSSLCISSLHVVEKDDDENEPLDELKLEVDAINAQYNFLCSKLSKLREEAIENAKKRWVTKKRVLAF